MGSQLDKISLIVDAHAVIFDRCLDSALRVITSRATPQMYGDEADVSSAQGPVSAAIELFNRVVEHMDLDEDSMKEVLKEYDARIEEDRRRALEARGGGQTVQVVAEDVIGGSSSG